MPWKETTNMEQKIEFFCEWRTGKHTITELCKGFGISRPTTYKIITRFEEKGYDGLIELARTPRRHPKETGQEIVNKEHTKLKH